jgi:hypothetical protein
MTIRAQHDRGMDYAQDAMLARFHRDHERAAHLSALALVHERNAADLAHERNAPEPTYSVLQRSAAWCAYNAGEPLQAAELVCRALARSTLDWAREELWDVLRAVWADEGRPAD